MIGLFEKVSNEINEFEDSFRHALPIYVFKQSYRINFYEAWSFFLQDNLGFLDEGDRDYEIAEWLNEKEKPIDYLYITWLNCDEYFSEKYEDMRSFLVAVYRERGEFDDQYNQTW